MSTRKIEQVLPDLIEAIYEAGFDATQWQHVADLFRAAVPGSAFSNVVASPARFQTPVTIPSGWDEQYLRTYIAHYHTINPYPALLARIPPGQVILASNIASRRWLGRQAFYHEWLKPAGNYTHGASLSLARPGSAFTRLSFDIPEAYRHWEGRAGTILARTAPHIVRALDLSEKYHARVGSAGISDALLELIDAAVFVVDDTANVQVMNSRADALLRTATSVLSRGNRLHFQHHRTDLAFRTALMSCVSKGQTVTPNAFKSTDGVETSLVLVLPLRAGVASLATGPVKPLALVFIEVGQRRLSIADTILQELYGLTTAERRIVLEIARGYAPAEVAAMFGIARTTVRNQLATAMRKLAVSRQSELAALVAGLVPSLDARRRRQATSTEP